MKALSNTFLASLVTYNYDALGRITNRAINGVAEQLAYDHLGRVVTITNALGSFTNTYLEGGITVQGFGEFYKPAEERLNQLLGELPKLEADLARMKIDQVSVEEVVFEVQHLYEQWPKLEVEKKRAIVESIFEKVEIGEGKINITYSGLTSSEELCKSQQQMAPATSMRRQSRLNFGSHGFLC